MSLTSKTCSFSLKIRNDDGLAQCTSLEKEVEMFMLDFEDRSYMTNKGITIEDEEEK